MSCDTIPVSSALKYFSMPKKKRGAPKKIKAQKVQAIIPEPQEQWQPLIKLFLGGVIILLSAVLAYLFFSLCYNQTTPKLTSPVPDQLKLVSGQEGELAGGESVVALPTVHLVMEGDNLWQIAEY